MAFQANFSCFSDNLSVDSVLESVWSLDPVVESDTATRYAITALTILLFIIGVPLNIMVILSIIKMQLYQQQPTILLLLNLSFTDLLICLLVLPPHVVTLISGRFNFGNSDATLCSVCQTGVIFLILTYVSLGTLAVISVDRFIYLKGAMQYTRLVTHVRAAVAILIVWLVSIATLIPTLFGFGEMRFSTAVGVCIMAFSGSTSIARNAHYLIFTGIIVSIPIVTLAITNIWAMCIIQKQLRIRAKRIKAEKKTHRNSFHKRRKEENSTLQMNLVKIYSTIFITNIITWLPSVARLIIAVAAEENEYTKPVRIIGSVAYISLTFQSVIHPIVQTYLIHDVRKGILFLYFSFVKKCHRSPDINLSVTNLPLSRISSSSSATDPNVISQHNQV